MSVAERGALRTGELVEAAVLADVAVLLIVAGWFLPVSGLFWAASVVPFAALLVRHRVRALFVSACAGGTIALLVLGPGLSFQVGAAAITGFVVGTSIKRGWGPASTVAFALATVWTTVVALGLSFLTLFGATRRLAFDQLRIQWEGSKRFALGVIKAGDLLVTRTHAGPAYVLAVVELGPLFLGVLLGRSRRRAQRAALGAFLGVYAAVSFAFDAWAGALVLVVAGIGVVASRQVPQANLRRVTLRTWTACVVATVLALSLGGRAPYLRQLDRQWTVVAPAARRLLHALFPIGDLVLRWCIAHWWLAIPAALVAPIAGVAFVTREIAIPVVRRIERAVAHPVPARPPDAGAAGPVPVSLEDVSFTYEGSYAGAPRPAVDGVTLTIPAGSYVGIVGDNGSGKSTLARILAGTHPTSGEVRRPATAAVGRPGGTAMIFQRPESQVLGVRVHEDVVWGLVDPSNVDVAELLAVVGLAGFEGRETSTLSGGELQRLAIAAALARTPALIVSDEATAMVDPAGRIEIVRLFNTLAARGMTVVHITHRMDEVRDAGLAFKLAHGRLERSGEASAVIAPPSGDDEA